MSKPIILCFTILFTFVACNDCTKEEDLVQRENALQLREMQIAEKESEYLSLVSFRDSVRLSMDTLTYRAWPDSIAGKWNSRTICTESNCSDYAVGDQRVNVWIFDQDSTGLNASVLDNRNEIIRTYNAKFTPRGIQLSFRTDSTSTRNVVMNVNFDQIRTDKMSGKRIISLDEKCSALFNIELNRPSQKN
ncbi:MAG: hypothetical protein GX159_00140 [Flavobacteriaceae bacterium]|jgi:hypothetical protein|nr:hypothetical protein [Flavobacteriaceae bacterium]